MASKKRQPLRTHPSEAAMSSGATHAVNGRWLGKVGAPLRFAATYGLALLCYFSFTITCIVTAPPYLERHPLLSGALSVKKAVSASLLMPYQELIAKISSNVLSVVGYSAQVTSRDLQINGFKVTVANGCDSIEVSLLLGLAIIFCRGSFAQKLIGVSVGVFLIALVNLLRIVCLCIWGVEWPDSFDFAHSNLWPLLLICVTVAIFIGWIRYVQSHGKTKAAI